MQDEYNFLYFISAVELKFDPEESFKRIRKKGAKITKQSRLMKFEKTKAKIINSKMMIELMPFQVIEACKIFIAKVVNKIKYKN